jgi:choline dehydrogenase-like flavoprotein
MSEMTFPGIHRPELPCRPVRPPCLRRGPRPERRRQPDAHTCDETSAPISPGGTCRIGTDGEAVVDTDLRVHGVSGLRVADASVMPSAPSANTNATVYVLLSIRTVGPFSR